MAIASLGSTGFGALGAVDNVVSFPVVGQYFASGEFVLSGTFVGTVTWEMALDPKQVNWIASPYAQRTDAVSANPAVSATATAAGTYEIPTPANCTGLRARCTAYTSGSIVVQGGPARAYAPGMPVTATLYDVTSAVNTALDTGILDFSGWSGAKISCITPAGGSGKIYYVDDLGGNVYGGGLGAGGNALFNVAASNINTVEFGPSLASNLAASISGQGVSAGGPLFKRMDVFSAAVAGLASRIRIEVSR